MFGDRVLPLSFTRLSIALLERVFHRLHLSIAKEHIQLSDKRVPSCRMDWTSSGGLLKGSGSPIGWFSSLSWFDGSVIGFPTK